MPVGMLGRKVGTTQVYNEDGNLVPVTVIEAGPCVVLQVRTPERDGYEAVQIGFGGRRQRRLAEGGVEAAPKAGCEPKRFVREFRTDGEKCELEVGGVLTVGSLGELKRVDVIGRTKGRGFAGVMKRHNFSGQRASHGVKRVHRHGGSIGQSADPARVIKGTKMPGRYGNTSVTVRNLKVVRIDEENNMLLVAGSVPGPAGSYVSIRHSKKQK
ncbi:UNVERIFIED_CONTAM: hypothetical protein GTU68_033519 [Idotea baltica]|nr:hypothetical protein [Idotea baltica]